MRKSLCGYTLQARVDYTALIQYGGWIRIHTTQLVRIVFLLPCYHYIHLF